VSEKSLLKQATNVSFNLLASIHKFPFMMI